MHTGTPLLRQIHPEFVRDDWPTSQAFGPTPKDQNLLSCDDGDRIDAVTAWRQFTARGLNSAGVMAVTVGECAAQNLSAVADGNESNPTHVSIDFTRLSTSQRKNAAKKLRDAARARGWRHRP